jgi:putative methanogenesis marker protein 17
MLPIEYFEVECEEATGGELYQKLAGVVLLDHDLIRVIAKLHIFIDPTVPLFVAVGITKRLPGPVQVRDVGDVNAQEGRITISIAHETHLAPLLTLLWDKFGKERVDQPDRFTIILHGVDLDAGSLMELPVIDPSEALYKDLIYALQVIQPEGFKVRRQFYGDGKFWFVASENTICEDIMPLIREKFARMGETL